MNERAKIVEWGFSLRDALNNALGKRQFVIYSCKATRISKNRTRSSGMYMSSLNGTTKVYTQYPVGVNARKCSHLYLLYSAERDYRIDVVYGENF